MAGIVVVGAGLCGLSTAIMLAGDGHHVTVIERDPAPPPGVGEAAWLGWERRGVNQFRLLHMFAPRWGQIVDREMPAVAAALEAAGGLRANPLRQAPDSMTGGWRDGDERFEVLTGRRPVVEAALAEVAGRTPGVEVRRGESVAGLRTGEAAGGDIAHVSGVRTSSGHDIDGDLVVDASGRRSALASWLTAVGGRAPGDEVEEAGFVYYGRHFRSADGSIPPLLGGVLQHHESVGTVTLPGDNGTWGVGIIASGADADLRPLRNPDTWNRTLASFPLVAHWADAQSIDDAPSVMAGLEDRRRRFVIDDRPVATGIVAVGDSWACTNPSLGRGASLGLMQVEVLRDQIRTVPLSDHVGFALAFDRATDAVVGPWYRATHGFDRHRLAEIHAQVRGVSYRSDDPTWVHAKAMDHGAMNDPQVLRGLAQILSVVATPEEVLAQPGMNEAVRTAGAGWEDASLPGPSRRELLEIVRGRA